MGSHLPLNLSLNPRSHPAPFSSPPLPRRLARSRSTPGRTTAPRHPGCTWALHWRWWGRCWPPSSRWRPTASRCAMLCHAVLCLPRCALLHFCGLRPGLSRGKSPVLSCAVCMAGPYLGTPCRNPLSSLPACQACSHTALPRSAGGGAVRLCGAAHAAGGADGAAGAGGGGQLGGQRQDGVDTAQRAAGGETGGCPLRYERKTDLKRNDCNAPAPCFRSSGKHGMGHHGWELRNEHNPCFPWATTPRPQCCPADPAEPALSPWPPPHTPNASPQVPLSQLFKPLVSVEPSDPASWGAHPLVRVGVGAGLAGLLYVLYAHAPDKGATAGRGVTGWGLGGVGGWACRGRRLV